MKNLNLKKIALLAIIAALYTQLTLFIPDLSFQAFQFRLGEVLTILPLFSNVSVFGLTLGCFVSNFVGVYLGKSVFADIFFGTFATFIAAMATNFIGKSKIKKFMLTFGPLPAVIVNGIIIGLELTFFNSGANFLFNVFSVAFGEFVVCYGLGVPLIYFLLKNNLYKKLFSKI